MLRRVALLVGLCATALPFGSSASASCLDDLTATNFLASDAPFDESDHWGDWVHVEGTANVIVEGDDLIHDAGQLVPWTPEFTQDVVANASGATTAFVTCVAG